MNGLVKNLGIGFKEGIILQHEEADWEEDFIVGDIAESGAQQTGVGAGLLARQYQVAFTDFRGYLSWNMPGIRLCWL